MYMWGVILMFIGGLSFVLPLLGRQFVLVTALGLTGIGGAASGILLLVVGAFLFYAARKRDEEAIATEAVLRMRQRGEIRPGLQSELTPSTPVPSNGATHNRLKPDRLGRAYAADEIQQVLSTFRRNIAEGKVTPVAIRLAMPNAELSAPMKRVAALRLEGKSEPEAGEIALLELMQVGGDR